jgi:hypothetical protein
MNKQPNPMILNRKRIKQLLHISIPIFYLFILPYGSDALSAQGINGSQPGPGYIAQIILNRTTEQQVLVDTLDPQLNVTLTIRPFVVKSEDGLSHFIPATLDLGVTRANQYFSNIGIQFITEELQSIPEYEYATITHRDSTVEMEVKYAGKDYINLFLVDSIIFNGLPYYGYTFFPNDTIHSAIFLCKAIASGTYLTTLLGNFFGLLNTHETGGGIEYVDRSNCNNAGDYICDTWADPGLYGTVGDECLYAGTFRDPNGDFYIPSVANLMSESNDMCKCVFSLEQYQRMMFYYINYRNYLR